MANLGSEGERILQKKFGSENKASAFYDKQLLDYLNPYMREFILKQEMVFIATADSKGECDCSFRAGKKWNLPSQKAALTFVVYLSLLSSSSLL